MCTSLQAHHLNPHLNDIHKKLETITTHLDTFAMAQPPANHSYAHVAATGAKNTTSPKAHPGLHFELTLAQANCSHPVLSELSNDGLLEKINETLMDMGCHFESRPCTPDRDGSVVREYVMPHIHAVGCHRSGDIWLVTYSEAECDFLACAAHRWALRLSSQLSVAHKTFPVLVHGMPTNFDPSRSSDDIRHLIVQNNHLVTHPSVLQHAEFLSQPRTGTAFQHKTHGSLILYLTYFSQFIPNKKDQPMCTKCPIYRVDRWSAQILFGAFPKG